ncbi:MAG: response regulator transcription factor [Granulosicoccus sp.]
MRFEKPLHILVMDDDVEFAFYLSQELEQFYQVTWCRCASEALEVLNMHRVDLVIADIFVYQKGVPVADGGITLIGAMRVSRFRAGERDCSEIPVIAVTSSPEKVGVVDVLTTASNLGAQAVMEKPLDVPSLLDTIEGLLGSERAPVASLALQTAVDPLSN